MSDRDSMTNNLVQIKACSEEEVQRRIDAFIENKRNEMDERNIREFISPFSSDSGNSCARVEAIYVHREGQKSHITLKNVVNLYGPQTQQSENDSNSQRNVRLPLEMERREAVEERLQNMESHVGLSLQTGTGDVYKRLKALEERIMFLEGLSPEYFSQGIPQPKPVIETQDEQEEKKASLFIQDESLSSINKRIDQLKQILKSKAEKRFCD